MLIVKDNDLYGTQDVIDHITELRASALSLPAYLTEATQYLASMGVIIEYSSIPSDYGTHIKRNRQYTGWKGTLIGKTHNTLSKSLLYGPCMDGWDSLHSKSFTYNKTKYHRVLLTHGESCTGGGADKFEYQRDYIILDTGFTAIQQQIAGVRTLSRTQAEFDTYILAIITTHRQALITARDKAAAKHRLLQLTQELVAIKKAVDSFEKHIAQLRALAHAEGTNSVITPLPDISQYAELDLKHYNELARLLGPQAPIQPSSELDTIYSQFTTFQAEHPEYFV